MPPYAEVDECGDGMEYARKSIESAGSVDEFRPIRQLGHGDMGAVFLVLHVGSGKPAAMKVISKQLLQKRKSFRRAWMEKEILSRLDHPFLPTLFAKFESAEYSFLVMSYCSGGDLNVLRQMQEEKRFSESVARFYAAEVVLALEYLHQHRILYRDLKPENILVQTNGHIMLTDFDLSLIVNDPKESRPKESQSHEESLCKKSKSTSSCLILAKLNLRHGIAQRCMNMSTSFEKNGIQRRDIQKDRCNYVMDTNMGKRRSPLYEKSHSFVGTEEYVAPEILWGSGHGYVVDWWAFGILLYEMVYGKTPFKGSTRKETFYNILCREPQFSGPWSPLIDLIQHLLAKDPSHRLGFNNDAQEIKNHVFFEGVRWSDLEYVSRPPFVPPPLTIESTPQGVLDGGVKTKEMIETF